MPQVKRKKGKKKGRGKIKADRKPAAGRDASFPSTDSATEDGDVMRIVREARTAGDPFHAVELYQDALRKAPENTVIMGEAAELLLQLGDAPTAKEVLARSILLAPEEAPDKYLYMAQLHEGTVALENYEKGLKLLLLQLERDGMQTKEEEAALKQRLCTAYCSVGELYLTDLCFDEDAETRCQDALERSLHYDYGGPEPLNAMANLRLSQSKPEEAVPSAEEAFRRLMLCEPPPDHEFRVSLAKILVECSANRPSCAEKALEVLSGLMEEDDENVEVWYLMAVAFNSLQPPDYESARTHLHRAEEMLSKIKKSQEEIGEVFSYEDQVRLVHEQLEVAKCAEAADKSTKDQDSKAASVVRNTSCEMDCA